MRKSVKVAPHNRKKISTLFPKSANSVEKQAFYLIEA